MARRVPLSLPSRIEASLREAYARTGVFSSIDRDPRPATVADLRMATTLCARAAEAVAAAEGDPGELDVEDWTWLALWRGCKHVYRIDPEVARELRSQPVDGEIPVEALRRVPYPIVYVEAKTDVSPYYGWPGAESMRSVGFLAYPDKGPEGEFLSFEAFFPGCLRRACYLPLDRAGTVDELVGWVEGHALDLLGAEPDPESARQEVEAVGQMVSLLLYVITEEQDVEVTFTPPSGGRGQKAGPKTNPETVHVLGTRVGRAIGEARHASQGGGSGETTGRTVAPHMRRAHWAHYWTGPRKGREDGRFGDELVVRWIPPVAVNADGGEAAETVHEDTKRTGGVGR